MTKRLEELTIVDRKPNDKSAVYFGAWVTLIDDNNDMRRYQIVGPDEFDVNQNKISMDSPLAQCLLKKQLGDEIIINTPNGEAVSHIEAIEY